MASRRRSSDAVAGQLLLELASRNEAANEAASLSAGIVSEAANFGNEAASEAARLTLVSLAKPLITDRAT